jgi:hypothetical protein
MKNGYGLRKYLKNRGYSNNNIIFNIKAQNKKNTLFQRNNTATTTDVKAGGGTSYEHKYRYIIHYDPELYKQNKKTQGKVRCGPFRVSKIRSFF